MDVNAGSTNVSTPHYFVDDVGGTNPGEPTTGLLFSNIETGGSASYQRQGAARVDLELKALSSPAADDAHDDGGFILIDDTNMPGTYRCDFPDAAFAVGVDFVILQLVAASASNTVSRPLLVNLTTVQNDLDNSTDGLGAIKGVVDSSLTVDISIATDTGTTLPALINGLTDITAAQVLSEVNDALDTAISELGVAAPTATPTLRTGLMLMYMALRNKTVVQTSGTDALEIHNDAGTKIAS
ncbi:unnamed protein product, partial [marine sediment metagenome]